MTTFFIGLAILLVGGLLYSKLAVKVFGPDDRKTPCYTKADGVDYVPMPLWKNSLINLLNIAGTGPILGPIQGVLFGPIAFLTIPLGNVFAGALHDYFASMVCLRDGGTQMPAMVRKYSSKQIYAIYQVFVSLLLLLVGVVFVYTPGDLMATQIFGFDGKATSISTWVIYGAIFVYYLVATIFPIDTIIGRIYPIFGLVLLFSAVGIFVGMFIKGYPLIELWDIWDSPQAFTIVDGVTQHFSYADYFSANKFLPSFFLTVACGLLSGFHSTQTAIITRTIKSEHEGRITFYGMMIVEGFIAMVWAAAAMGVYNLGLQEANASLATATVGVVCKHILGPIGGAIAIIGIIVLPITSGDTALRSLRMALTESFNIDQRTAGKRLGFASIIFVLAAAILVWAKVNSGGFNILWRYFSWSNQTLALFAFLGVAIWMFENNRAKWTWMVLVPGTLYCFFTVSFISNAKIGFNLPWEAAYIIGIAASLIYCVGIIIWGRKRAAKKLAAA